MRNTLSCLALTACALLVAACSSSAPASFGPGSVADASVDDGPDGSAPEGPAGDYSALIPPGTGDGGCKNLQCRQVDCASHGKPTTTISGVVYDPAGNRPLYDVFVYVPNATPAPIVAGNVSCSQCQAAASGSPLVSATTDATGRFVIQNAPAGADVPLVMQVGKWRRQIVIPHVTACADNPQTDKNATRLPSKSSEGDMPLIAFTSGGCDIAECFLRRMGIDDSEFVAPASTTGHVHVYTAKGGSSVDGGNTWQGTYQWWTDPKRLQQYDIVFDACDCAAYDRNGGGGTGDAYTAMHTYLNGGGRLFATHFYYNWFTPGTGPADFQSVANWCVGASSGGTCGQGNGGVSSYFIDTSFPKGKAFSDWLQAGGVTTTPGVIALDETQADLTNDVGTVNAGATRWIYQGSSASDPSYLTKHLTFNTPVGAMPDQQCGRAVFSEFHLSDFSNGAPFPSECTAAGPHTNNEAALEFLFFDLSSCVQNETQPPQPPPQ
jgi:hypothetical protein